MIEITAKERRWNTHEQQTANEDGWCTKLPELDVVIVRRRRLFALAEVVEGFRVQTYVDRRQVGSRISSVEGGFRRRVKTNTRRDRAFEQGRGQGSNGVNKSRQTAQESERR